MPKEDILKNTFLVMVTLLALAPCANRACAGDDPAAIIADFGSAQDIKILEGDHIIPLELGTPLSAGTIISATKDGFVRLLVGGGCLVVGSLSENGIGECRQPEGDRLVYTVPASDFFSGITERYERFRSVLAWWDPKTERKMMRSRDGAAVVIPALDGVDHSFIVSGQRELHLRWIGGTAPYKVALTDASGKKIKGITDDANRTSILAVKIEVGSSYTLTVTDTATEKTTYVLTGAEPAAMPIGSKGSPLVDAMALLELVSASDGAWAVEAAQQIRALPLERRMRDAALDAVDFGDWP